MALTVKSVRPAPLAFRVSGRAEETIELMAWLANRVPQTYHEGHRWVEDGGVTFHLDFKDRQAAMLFKLTWVD